MEDFLIKFALWLLSIGLCCLIWTLLTRRSRREDKRRDAIEATSVPVWATMVSLVQTRHMDGGQFNMLLTLDVLQPNGQPRRVTITDQIDLGWSLRPGDQVQVYLDTANQDNVFLNKIMSPRYSKANERS